MELTIFNVITPVKNFLISCGKDGVEKMKDENPSFFIPVYFYSQTHIPIV